MTTMKAVRIRSFGGPEVLELADIQGRVHPHVSAVFELEHAAEAQAQLERHHSQGKVVLQMG